MNRRYIGAINEAIAADFLKNNGLVILEQNYRNRFGEIDIIAKDMSHIVFVEVKYRKTANTGHPEEAVNLKKAKTICKVADYYIISKKLLYNTQYRFDVVAIEDNNIRWHKNAFDYIR